MPIHEKPTNLFPFNFAHFSLVRVQYLKDEKCFYWSTIETLRKEIIRHQSNELVGRNFSIRLSNAAKSSDFTDISQVTEATLQNIKLIQKGFSDFKESEAIEMAKLEVMTIADIKRMKPTEFAVLFVSNEELQSEESSIVCTELQ